MYIKHVFVVFNIHAESTIIYCHDIYRNFRGLFQYCHLYQAVLIKVVSVNLLQLVSCRIVTIVSISIEKYQFFAEKQRLLGHGSFNTTTLKLLGMIYSKFSKRNLACPLTLIFFGKIGKPNSCQ